MKPLIALSLLILLAGCTDREWSGTMSFIGFEKTPPGRAVARPAQPVARAASMPVQTIQAAQPNSFCQSVAQQDTERNGFDAATQNRVFVRSYQQCVGIFGNTPPQ